MAVDEEEILVIVLLLLTLTLLLLLLPVRLCCTAEYAALDATLEEEEDNAELEVSALFD